MPIKKNVTPDNVHVHYLFCVFHRMRQAIETGENRADIVSDQIKKPNNKQKSKDVNLVSHKGSGATGTELGTVKRCAF